MAIKKQPQGNLLKKILIVLVVIFVIALGLTGINYYLKFRGPNVTANQEYLYIRTGSTYDDVYQTIRDKEIVKDTTTFSWAAHNMHYITRVKPGRYRLKDGMSNRDLLNMLISGRQEPVNVTIKNLRMKENFAGYMAKKLEADSMSIISLLDSDQYVKELGFNRETVYTMILPDTYQFYWNATPRKILNHLYSTYTKFWNPERKQKAAEMHLTPVEVSVLASIVDAEALHDDEMPIIAGLYYNRLTKGMKLEADPTVIFATGDFTIHRVLNKQLAINSPYNTYMYKGLPPGPIMMPSVNAIKAVLAYDKNDYIYMCAKEDFSGYHNFATTMAQHMINAHKFQKALNERNIRR